MGGDFDVDLTQVLKGLDEILEGNDLGCMW
jgi:hypothetical protein